VQATVGAHARADSHSVLETRVVVLTVLIFGLALSAVVLLALEGPTPRATLSSTATTLRAATFPVGAVNVREPSRVSPPGGAALPGYRRVYATDFKGSSLPAGWVDFTGVPGGDPGGQFAPSHVVVTHGMLELNTWRDPSYNDKWVSGGLCQCGDQHTYGAFFVRSRITGAGPNEVELLWPASNKWPPEIDFYETGSKDNSTSWTLHYGKDNNFVQQTLRVDQTAWHTWGVIWTPTKITYTVDGRVWGSFSGTYAIPTVPMTLDLQQRPGCSLGPVCTSVPQSMLVDWVAEYERT
jgi:Glycosyl hydrolases family 16